ncbi:MAG: molybdopterin-dependent oxidoreductase [Micropruina sp.]
MRADRRQWTRPRTAAAGVLAMLAALAVGHLVAGLVAPAASPALAVGSRLIDLAPTPVKDWAVSTLGTADKPALVAGVVLVTLGIGAVTGLLAARHRGLVLAVPAVLAVIGTLAASASGAWSAVPSVVAGIVSGAVLAWLLPRPMTASAPGQPDGSPRAMPRRALLIGAGVVGGSSAVALVTGQWFADRARIVTDVRLPPAAPPLRPLPAGLDVPGLQPWVTPTSDFYRVDINLLVPGVDVATWRLDIDGLVDRPFSLSWDELTALPVVERDITLNCVSNDVGGPSIGGARWLGVRTRDLLQRAGVRPEADQVLSRSVDGFTVSTPVQALIDDRDALVAIGINGRPLPAEHGFPARLITPGLYGYVGATKWLTRMTLTTYAHQAAYWTTRGWAARGPVKPSSRIEVPHHLSELPLSALPGGKVTVAGTAWAQQIGVARVQVRVDDGEWRDATLGPDAGIDYWRQWRFTWPATPGRHTLESRLIDERGVVQSDQVTPPFPDGASGLHRITVTIG